MSVLGLVTVWAHRVSCLQISLYKYNEGSCAALTATRQCKQQDLGSNPWKTLPLFYRRQGLGSVLVGLRYLSCTVASTTTRPPSTSPADEAAGSSGPIIRLPNVTNDPCWDSWNRNYDGPFWNSARWSLHHEDFRSKSTPLINVKWSVLLVAIFASGNKHVLSRVFKTGHVSPILCSASYYHCGCFITGVFNKRYKLWIINITVLR